MNLLKLRHAEQTRERIYIKRIVLYQTLFYQTRSCMKPISKVRFYRALLLEVGHAEQRGAHGVPEERGLLRRVRAVQQHGR